MYLGDFRIAKTVRFMWNSNAVAGESITRATNGTVSVYKDGGLTQSTTGVTDTEDFDALTGVHFCAVDTSADGTFYSAGSDFAVVLSAATIDGKTINAVLAHFSLEARSGLMPTTDGRKLDVSAGGEAGVDWANVGSPTTTVGLSGTTVKTATDVETKIGTPSNLGGGATLAANLSDIEAQTDDIGAAGAGLTAVPWNAAWDAEVQSEVADALDAAVPGSPTSGSINERIKTMDDADIPGRLPAALTAGGNIKADSLAISGDATAADNLETMLDGTGGQVLTLAQLRIDASAMGGAIDIDNSGGPCVAMDNSVVSTHAVTITAGGTGSKGLVVTGVSADIDADITGNVSGSVGSVTGAVGSVTGNVGGNVTGSVGSLATQAKADVNGEVVDCLNVDTYAEPASAPAATSTLRAKIGWIFKMHRNKRTQTATTETLFADDGSTADSTSTKSDDGTTFTRGEFS